MPALKKSPAVLRQEMITKKFKIGLLEKGWTVKHLAELCGMDAGTMSRAINHPMSVKLETVLNIAKKLGIDSIPT